MDWQKASSQMNIRLQKKFNMNKIREYIPKHFENIFKRIIRVR